MSRVELLKIGPHHYFETALNTFCLREIGERLRFDAECEDCERVLAVYREQMLLPEGDRCQGKVRGGYRCQRDGIYNGFCPSHLDQDPKRTHLHRAAV